MGPLTDGEKWRVDQADCLEWLRSMPDGYAHCCITSPPYFGLRNYGHDGQIGLEATPTDYVAKLAGVFAEVRRVLRPDGVLWANFGDSYHNYRSHLNGGAPTNTVHRGGSRDGTETFSRSNRGNRLPGLKEKDLIGIPWRVAFALQADGWYLRSDLPWVKRSAMPESVTDRPAKALEYFFLLTPSPSYFFDMEAVRMKPAASTLERDRYSRVLEDDGPQAVRHDHETAVNPAGRSFRNTDLFYESLESPHGLIAAGDEMVGLDVTPASFKGAHFATFPPGLVTPLLLAGTSAKGCCPSCGAPRLRVVERKPMVIARSGRTHELGRTRSSGTMVEPAECKTVGWKQSCPCPPADPAPCRVIDPFAGSGTTGVVALRHGRHFLGCDLSAEYCAMARKRIGNETPSLALAW